jgi:MoaA/NifB/PqqE/SkfB family radical SAM enzyme
MTAVGPNDSGKGRGTSTSAVPLPAVVQIEPTSRCNLRCLGCAHQHRKGNLTDIPFERAIALLDELRGHTTEIILSGIGEPLLNPQLAELLAYAKRSPAFHTTIASNFTLMNRKALEALFPVVDKVICSLDAADEKTFEAVRPGAKFDVVRENLQRFLDCDARSGRKKYISISTLVVDRNAGEIYKIYQMIKDWHISRFHVALCYTADEYEHKPETISQFIRDTQRIRSEGPPFLFTALGGKYCASQDPSCQSDESCTIPWRYTYVSSRLHVLPCCLALQSPDLTAYETDCSMGSLEQSTLTEIWNGAEYNSFRQQLAAGQLPALCQPCYTFWKKDGTAQSN